MLRRSALIAVLIAAGASVAFQLYAGRASPQRLVLILIALWVLGPFVVLLLASTRSKSWSILTRSTLHWLMLVVSLGSLGVYLTNAIAPLSAKAAAVFVLIPPLSVLVIALALSTAAIISRGRSNKSAG